MKTIAIDFDGVIHKYSGGWKDGSIYDRPFEGVFKAIKILMDNGYAVFIISSRSYGVTFSTYGFPCQIIPFKKKNIGRIKL